MSRFTMPFVQWMDGNGNPLTGGELFFYDFGTTNPKDTFSDAGLTTPNTNPVVAGGVGDANGVWGAIFLGAGDYTVVLKDEDGNTVWTSGAQPVSADASGVTSVALTMPTAIFDVAGSPVTGSGTLAVTLDTQTANTLFVGPTTGAAAAPTFRAMVLADLPVGGSTDGQVLTSTGAATAPAWETPIISKSYTSSNQTLTAAGALTLAHGLGAKPKLIQYFLVCTDAGGDAGYAQNDEVQMDLALASYLNSASAQQSGMGVKIDSTNITIRFSSTLGPSIPNATTGAFASIDITKWALVVRAFA
jgi:hypothetical protein